MASVRKEFIVRAGPGFVRADLRDLGAVHVELAPGFVAGCSLEEDGAVRVVTFGNMMQAGAGAMRSHLETAAGSRVDSDLRRSSQDQRAFLCFLRE